MFKRRLAGACGSNNAANARFRARNRVVVHAGLRRIMLGDRRVRTPRTVDCVWRCQRLPVMDQAMQASRADDAVDNRRRWDVSFDSRVWFPAVASWWQMIRPSPWADQGDPGQGRLHPAAWVAAARGAGPAGETRFDVVLLDVTMPDIEPAVRSPRSCAPPSPGPGPVIVMLCGRDIVEVDIAAREAGADGVMAEPVDQRKLLKLLETLKAATAGDGVGHTTPGPVCALSHTPPSSRHCGRMSAFMNGALGSRFMSAC